MCLKVGCQHQPSSLPLKGVNILVTNVFSTRFLPLQGIPSDTDYFYIVGRPSVHKHIISSLILASLKKVIAWPAKPQLVLLVQKQPSSCLQSVLLVSFVTIWRSKRAVTTWLLGLLRSTKRQGSGHLLLKDWGIWIMDSCWKNVPNFFKDILF